MAAPPPPGRFLRRAFPFKSLLLVTVPSKQKAWLIQDSAGDSGLHMCALGSTARSGEHGHPAGRPQQPCGWPAHPRVAPEGVIDAEADSREPAVPHGPLVPWGVLWGQCGRVGPGLTSRADRRGWQPWWRHKQSQRRASVQLSWAANLLWCRRQRQGDAGVVGGRDSPHWASWSKPSSPAASTASDRKAGGQRFPSPCPLPSRTGPDPWGIVPSSPCALPTQPAPRPRPSLIPVANTAQLCPPGEKCGHFHF